MTSARPSTASLVAAFAAVYLIWGSTYLAIRVAVETIPPFLMLGLRFSFAGGVLYAWLRTRGVEAPTRGHWRTAIVTGIMMLFLGTGLVGVAEQSIPSGIAALLVAATPLWMVLLGWLWKHGPRPHATVFAGITLGFVGVFLLLDPRSLGTAAGGGLLPGLMVVFASLSWAAASIHAKDGNLPKNPFLTSAMQMAAGGAVLLVASPIFGEWSGFAWAQVTARSAWALAYLVVFGSFVAFSAFVWLLRITTPARVSTYAFVNPGVAVILGWILLDEPLNLRIFASLALLTVSVIGIVRYGR